MISLKIESKPKFILLLIRLRCSCLETRSLLSVVYLFLSLTGGTPHYVRQTPPVGRSEKAKRHSPELQWSPIPITFDLRYHCIADRSCFEK